MRFAGVRRVLVASAAASASAWIACTSYELIVYEIPATGGAPIALDP